MHKQPDLDQIRQLHKFRTVDLLKSAAEAIAEIEKSSGLHFTGMPSLKMGVSDGIPHITMRPMLVLPLHLPVGIAPTKSGPKSPRSSASDKPRKNSSKSVTTESAEASRPQPNL